jgi:hypothetical protein
MQRLFWALYAVLNTSAHALHFGGLTLRTTGWGPLIARSIVSGIVVASPLGLEVITPRVVHAGEAGTKSDKTFELCVSRCVFEETKPPPIGSTVERLEAKDRKTIVTDCRKGCAKTKAQLMLGEPKPKKVVEGGSQAESSQ